MVQLRLEVDASDFELKIGQRVLNQLEYMPSFVIREATQIVESTMREMVPVKSGRLRDSIRSIVYEGQDARGEVYTSSGYGLFVDQDTGPHIIRARVARMLRFEIQGTVYFRKQVHHPGTKGQHFVAKTLRASRGRIRDAMEEGFQKLNSGELR